jgi:hypothetical protein
VLKKLPDGNWKVFRAMGNHRMSCNTDGAALVRYDGFRDITFLAAGRTSERSRSAAIASNGWPRCFMRLSPAGKLTRGVASATDRRIREYM